MLTWIEENWPTHPAAFVIAVTLFVLAVALLVASIIGVALGIAYLDELVTDHVPGVVAWGMILSVWAVALLWALTVAWRATRNG